MYIIEAKRILVLHYNMTLRNYIVQIKTDCKIEYFLNTVKFCWISGMSGIYLDHIGIMFGLYIHPDQQELWHFQHWINIG